MGRSDSQVGVNSQRYCAEWKSILPGYLGEALLASKQRWKASTNNIKNREPFGYSNFIVLARFHLYSNLILNMGPTWIGCGYSHTMMWYPPKDYHHDYELLEGHTNSTFSKVKQKHDFRLYKEEVHPSYSLTQLHLNHIVWSQSSLLN